LAARAPALARDVVIRALREQEVDEADHLMRLAFGTYFGAPDPIAAMGDAEHVRPRYAAQPDWAFAAELDGELVGSNIATRWGSFGFFGPLSVRPDLWDRGIGGALMAPIVELLDAWGVRQAALFTFANSAKHAALYQRFGFWPQYLTALMERRLAAGAPSERAGSERAGATHAQAGAGRREALVGECREVTEAIFAGLDVSHEIHATDAQRLGETVFLHDGAQLCGFAVCHCGAGEAGSGCCYVKFGAVLPGAGAGERFERLLDECEALAAARGLERVLAGVNLARHDAYRRLLARGYRTRLQGVIMQRPNEPGYCRADVHAIDDLR
jgi:predicted N-acetyltransferase YhbS